MTRLAKEALRWTPIALFGGCGGWLLWEAGHDAVARGCCDLFGVVLVVFDLLLTVPFFTVAYICFRRRYRELFFVFGVVGSIALFFELMALPEQLGIDQFLDRRIHNGEHEYGFLGFPLVILSLFVPILAAAWFYRLCERLACGPRGRPLPRTRATGWLVWLGVFCTVLSLLGMLFFNRAATAPPTPVSVEAVHLFIFWGTGMSLFGAFLVFLGLVLRRSVSKPESAMETKSETDAAYRCQDEKGR